MFFRPFHLLYVYRASGLLRAFPPFQFHQLYIFPHFPPITCLPAFSTSYLFFRPFHLFNIFAEKKSYYAGIMLDAPSIVLCSKLCRHNVSDPRAFPWLQVSPVLPWLQVFLRFSQVTSSRAAFKDLPEFTTSRMLSLIAFLLTLIDAL